MIEWLKKGRCVLAVVALAVTCLGFATPAMADGEPTYGPDGAKLTAVIVAPAGTNASQDEYTFHFAGGGEVVVEKDNSGNDHVYSGGTERIEQDGATIKDKDIVPTIPDVTLKGEELTGANTLTNGQLSQTVVQKSITEILTEESVAFPHAGVYTYVVTEQSARTALNDGTYINPSQAQYKLRIYVVNTKTGDSSALGDRKLTVDKVTVDQMKDDNGNEGTGKVDPTYPQADNGKITYTADGVSPDNDKLAGDARGRFVDGFTFANEYIKGGAFQVKKLYDGNHSDRTKYSLVELTVYSAAAAGSCLTYRIEGEGIDETENNKDNNGEHVKLNGIRSDIPQNNDYMATFNDQGWVTIKAELKEDSAIRITGEFGPYSADYENDPANPDHNRRKILSASGLLQGQTYYVIERNPGHYRPTGYVYSGEDSVDPRKQAQGMVECPNIGDSPIENDPTGDPQGLPAFALCVDGTATGSATTVFVVNTLDEAKVSPTGILIDNLPYVLMIGIPVAVFIALFALKRRRNAVE